MIGLTPRLCIWTLWIPIRPSRRREHVRSASSFMPRPLHNCVVEASSDVWPTGALTRGHHSAASDAGEPSSMTEPYNRSHWPRPAVFQREVASIVHPHYSAAEPAVRSRRSDGSARESTDPPAGPHEKAVIQFGPIGAVQRFSHPGVEHVSVVANQ